MKKVLLTTTAVVFTAGFASAGDMSMSGAIKLTYGSFGTGSQAGAAVDDFASEALCCAMGVRIFPHISASFSGDCIESSCTGYVLS